MHSIRFATTSLSLALLVAACSSSGGSSGGTPTDGGLDGTTTDGGGSGVVPGPMDAHCIADGGAKITQEVLDSSCHPGAVDAGDADAPAGAEFGDTMYNAEGDDDDCKYHMKWSATPVAQGTDVTFTVTVTTLGDGKPAKSASPRLEVYLNDTHPAPNTDQKATETSDGVYTVGPIRFDASGKWTVRFHVHEDCEDLLPTSPHGHAAFYVSVP